MEELVGEISKLYTKYQKSPKVLDKFNFYIKKQLPSLLEKYTRQEEKRIYIEKESNKYINEFLSNPDKQYFYIANTDIFIKYNGENYELMNEDELWYNIFSGITNRDEVCSNLIECKEKIKNIIVKSIKQKNIFNTIPESYTVQHIINFFTPTLFNTKEEVKYFLAVLGDNILNKKKNLSYFVPTKSKDFFEVLESLCESYFKSKLGITSPLKYKYRGQVYNESRLIYFTRAIGNKSCWFSFLKDNLFNLIVVCCHYSARYINSENYANKQNSTFKSNVFYWKDNSKEDIIKKFIHLMIEKGVTTDFIHFKDIYFLWKIYLKQINMPNMIYKGEFENIIRDQLNYYSNNFIGIKSNYLVNVSYFKEFCHTYILTNTDNVLEISEMHKLLTKWLDDTNNEYVGFHEENLKDMLEYFYENIVIDNGKFLIGVSCRLWDKQKDMREAVQKKFNKKITENLTLYNAYVMYCKYSNNNGKLLTVSKKYFYKYIDRIIPEQYIKNNNILFSYWNTI